MFGRAKHNYKSHPGQLVNYASESYLDRTSRPIYALVYLLGFIIFYEIGTFVINPEVFSESLSNSQRVVSFVWIQNLLEYIGFSARATWIGAPLVVVVILLALQVTSGSRWFVKVKDFIPMTAECILLAVPLLVLSLVLNRSIGIQTNMSHTRYLTPCSQVSVLADRTDTQAPTFQSGESVAIPTSESEVTVPGKRGFQVPRLMVDIITGIGAGIYEELVFRLILICLLMLVFQDILLLSRRSSIVLSILISAGLFSAHHHIFFIDGQFSTGELFSLARFTFRTLAGVYFAILFAVRGFGIAAGTHAFYDIIATLLNALTFSPQD